MTTSRQTDKSTRRRNDKATRSAPKGQHPPDLKAKAVEQLRTAGLAATHAATGISKPTLSRWAKAAGVDLAGPARERTATATAHRQEIGARTALNAVGQLERIVDASAGYVSAIVAANRTAAEAITALHPDDLTIRPGIDGNAGTLELGDPDASDALMVTRALDLLPLELRDAVGALTRAVHDLALLQGDATERGELVVQFAVPRPDPATPVVAEADLTGVA